MLAKEALSNPGDRALEVSRLLEAALSTGGEITEQEAKDFIECLELTIVELNNALKDIDDILLYELQIQRGNEVTNMHKRLENKSAKMIEEMQARAIKENKLKYNIAELSQRKEAAKTTVSTAVTLNLSKSKLEKEKKNLNKLRNSHKDNLKKLDLMARERKHAQSKVSYNIYTYIYRRNIVRSFFHEL